MNTVHAMSTCSISKKISKNFILPTGRLAKYKNVFISDASVLRLQTLANILKIQLWLYQGI